MLARRNRNGALVAAALVASLMVSGVATAAVDMFLKLDGIKGESVDPNHKDEIDILAWSWGLSNSGNTQSGGGGGVGKCNVQDLAVTKFVDASSPSLIVKAATGGHIANAKLTVARPGGSSQGYIVLELTDVLVSSVSTRGSASEDRLTENVTLNFASFKFTYTPPLKNGAAVPPIVTNINVAQGCVPR